MKLPLIITVLVATILFLYIYITTNVLVYKRIKSAKVEKIKQPKSIKNSNNNTSNMRDFLKANWPTIIFLVGMAIAVVGIVALFCTGNPTVIAVTIAVLVMTVLYILNFSFNKDCCCADVSVYLIECFQFLTVVGLGVFLYIFNLNCMNNSWFTLIMCLSVIAVIWLIMVFNSWLVYDDWGWEERWIMPTIFSGVLVIAFFVGWSIFSTAGLIVSISLAVIVGIIVGFVLHELSY